MNMKNRIPTNEEKEAVQAAAQEGKPIRVPLGWGVNSRIIVLNPELNPEGYTYEQMLHDPVVCMTVQSQFEEYCGTTLAETCDRVSGLPEEWTFSVEWQNTYDGQYFGCEPVFREGQVPDVEPCYNLDDVDDFMSRDFSRPLDNLFIKRALAYRQELVNAAKDFRYLDRKGQVAHFTVGFDGPLTVAAMLFGSDIFTLLALEPDKAKELLLFITRAAIKRTKALRKLAGQEEVTESCGLADDSIQLISGEMVESIVLPSLELWFAEMSTSSAEEKKRSMHLCGDATRHFRFLYDQLGVSSFDTGFPVDHGALRRELGPDVHISGGPHVSLLRNGTPEECYEKAAEILQSGVMTGGRFNLREGNNLPPCVPLSNLSAVYDADLTFGWYNRP